jgi:hypothetical protein
MPHGRPIGLVRPTRTDSGPMRTPCVVAHVHLLLCTAGARGRRCAAHGYPYLGLGPADQGCADYPAPGWTTRRAGPRAASELHGSQLVATTCAHRAEAKVHGNTDAKPRHDPCTDCTAHSALPAARHVDTITDGTARECSRPAHAALASATLRCRRRARGSPAQPSS